MYQLEMETAIWMRKGAVVVLGPDGSGKTTLVNALLSFYENELTFAYLGVSANQWRFPKLGSLYQATMTGKNPQIWRALNHSFLVSVDILARLWTPGPLGRVLIVERLPLTLTTTNLLFRWLLWANIQPIRLVILLRGDSAVFQQRKADEESIESIQKEQDKLARLVPKIPCDHVITINSDKLDEEHAFQLVTEELRNLKIVQA